MRLPNHLIEELVRTVAGDDTLQLVRLILDKENVSEFKIAEKLNITVNQTRNMLYRLNEHNLVSFTRKKDKKKGWYIYFWTFDTAKARSLIIERKQKKIAELKNNIKLESTTSFFSCPNKCTRVNAENALELQFKCPECNSLLKEEDNQQAIERMKLEIEKLRTELYEAVAAEVEKKPEIKKPKAKPKPKKRFIPKKKGQSKHHHPHPKKKHKPEPRRRR